MRGQRPSEGEGTGGGCAPSRVKHGSLDRLDPLYTFYYIIIAKYINVAVICNMIFLCFFFYLY